MNWIQENKFLTGFMAVLAVGVAVLAFLLYSAYGVYGEASQKYDEQAAALKNLQGQAPYPSAENLAKLTEQKEQMRTAVSELAQQLATFEFPVEPLRTTEFQDRLRAAVSATVERAAKNGVKLPDAFYLSYGEYQTTLPKDEATAAALGRELKAVEFVVNDLIEAKPESITGLEHVAKAGATPSPTPAKPPAKSAPAAAAPFVTARAFDLSFVIDQAKLRKFLNDITKAKQQFYIIRNIRVKNQVDKGPSRTEGADSSSAAAAVPEMPGAPGTAAKGPSLHFILGTEKVEVSTRIEIVDFTPPAAATK